MDTPGRFGGGHPLHPVNAAFKFQAAECAASVHGKYGLLDAAQFGHIDIDGFHFPIVALGITGVHAHQLRGEQACLFTAGAAAYFHNNIALGVGVLGKQQQF